MTRKPLIDADDIGDLVEGVVCMLIGAVLALAAAVGMGVVR